MLKILIIIGLVIAGCGTSSTSKESVKETGIGFSFFGMPSPNAKEILPHFLSLQVSKTAFLWKSFGDDYSSYDTWLRSQEGNATVEIHLFNGAGRRNERLGISDFLPDMSIEDFNHALEFHTKDESIRSFIRGVTLFANLHAGALHVRYILSLGLESNYSPLAAMNLLKIVTEEWPYEIAYNPLNPSDCDYMPSSVYCETHSTKEANKHLRCIVSNDGVDFLSKDEALSFISRNANCIILLWSSETQGISIPFVPTLERKFKFDNVEFFREILSE